MKAGKYHRVPLSAAALAILREVAALKDGLGLVFLDQCRGMAEMTLTAVLRRMGHGALTAHGFRSSFRDWAAEATHHPNHVVEQAFAHVIGAAAEAACRRGDLIAKRPALMDDQASYLAQTTGRHRSCVRGTVSSTQRMRAWLRRGLGVGVARGFECTARQHRDRELEAPAESVGGVGRFSTRITSLCS